MGRILNECLKILYMNTKIEHETQTQTQLEIRNSNQNNHFSLFHVSKHIISKSKILN